MFVMKDVESMSAQLSLIEYYERNESRSDIMRDIYTRVLVRRSKNRSERSESEQRNHNAKFT